MTVDAATVSPPALRCRRSVCVKRIDVVVALLLITVGAAANTVHGATARIAYRSGFDTLDPARARNVLTPTCKSQCFHGFRSTLCIVL